MVARGAGIFVPPGTPKTGHNRGSYGASPATKANNTFGYTLHWSCSSSREYIPQAMANICKAQGIPMVGNAAGNSKIFLDGTGEAVIAEMGRGSVYP